jgi:hypothetical protein
LHPEHGAGKGLDDLAFHLDLLFFLSQATSLVDTKKHGLRRG